jgi:hypothetical protein
MHSFFLIFSSFIALHSYAQGSSVADLKSQNRVKILKVLINPESEIIEEMRQGKIVESCMKIAAAYSASTDLRAIIQKDLTQLESHLLNARSNCSDLDMIRPDELYLKKLSRVLSLAKSEFDKL